MMPPLRLPLLSLLLVLGALLCPEAQAQGPKFAQPKPMDMKHLKLTLDVDLKKQRLDASAEWTLSLRQDSQLLEFHAIDLDLKKVTVQRSGKTLKGVRASNTGQRILVHMPAQSRGTKLFVRLDYSLEKPKNGLHFRAPSADDPDVPYQVWSQGESILNRYWIPCRDQPNERQSTELVVRVPKGYFALSNGKLLSKTTKGQHTTFHWRQQRPHVIYLVSLVVGQFDTITETWRGKPLSYHVPLGWKRHAMNSFANTKRMLDHFSELTGLEFPWDKYDQIVVEQFNYGGMENTSATTLNESTLHDKRAHIDFSSDGLVAHELAHQWFGDLMTCRDWSHIWLNEGFATYFEALWEEHDKGREAFLYNMWHKARSARSAGRSLPIVHRGYGHPDAVFDGRAYPKGAWMLHMLRSRLGDEVFWAGIRRYVQRFKDQAVESSDLRQCLEDSSGQSLERFFHDFVYRKGHPVLDLKFRWHGKTRLLEASLKQRGAVFELPARIDAWLASGQQITQTLVMNEASLQSFLSLPERPVRVRFDWGFGLLKEIKIDKPQDWWLEQLRSDSDVIGRIEAAHELAKRRRPELTRALIAALSKDAFWGARVEIVKALQVLGGDEVRAALIRGLSKQKDARVRRACAEALGRFGKHEDSVKALRRVLEQGDASYSVEAAAVTSYGRLLGEAGRELLIKQLEKNSHRDRIRAQALSALANLKDLGLLELFLNYSRGPHSLSARRSALEALGSLGGLAKLSPKDRRRILNRLRACLKFGSSRVRGAALRALRKMGRNAAEMKGVVALLKVHDPNERVRQAANEVAKSLGKGRLARPEMDKLKRELKALRAANDKQKERLSKLEALSAARAGRGRSDVESKVENKGSKKSTKKRAKPNRSRSRKKSPKKQTARSRSKRKAR